MTEQNPYSAPLSTQSPDDLAPINLAPQDRKKAEAIIKDAGQFWLAMILCLFCSLVGAVLIPVWYLVRLLQWNSLARKYPELVSGGFPQHSIQARFKSSQWKLIVGLVGGLVVFAILAVYFVILVFTI